MRKIRSFVPRTGEGNANLFRVQCYVTIERGEVYREKPPPVSHRAHGVQIPSPEDHAEIETVPVAELKNHSVVAAVYDRRKFIQNVFVIRRRSD